MQKPIFHNRTQLVINNILVKPSHAIILSGPSGVGKKHVAKYITKTLLDADNITDARHKFSQINIRPDEKGTISIDQIRELYQNTHNQHQTKQIITIINADKMGEPAQNSFLKLLEEPPANVYFILTVDAIKNLLPTIVSRSLVAPILPLTAQQAESQLSENYPQHDPDSIKQAVLKSSGKIGRAHRLLEQPETNYINIAKEIMSADRGDRVIKAQKYNSTRTVATDLLHAMLTVSEVAMRTSAIQAKSQSINAWARRITLISNALKRLENHGNPKIQLINVLYNL